MIAAALACAVGGAESDTGHPAGRHHHGGEDREARHPDTDGKFEFMATRVDCGKTQLGTADFGKQAEGSSAW